MNTKQWVISQLECKIQEGDLQNVVYVVHYRRQATEVDGEKTYFAETYSTLGLPAPDPSEFTPYEELTKEQVEGWLNENLPVADIDASLDAQIELQKNPTTSTPPLPWSANSNQ
ncbi:MAG: hypothetical protein FJY17_00745 [Bacteroidetes bacterium]|nr:hypothetical protein [Bacteroidota bacterium]